MEKVSKIGQRSVRLTLMGRKAETISSAIDAKMQKYLTWTIFYISLYRTHSINVIIKKFNFSCI